MKTTTILAVFVSALPFALTGPGVDKQVNHNSRLVPRTLDVQASFNVSVTQGDVNVQNFTFDELFTLQKRFLDNFIAPQNDIQVRLYLLDLHPTCANSYSRRSLSTRPSWPKMSKDVLILRAHLTDAN